MLGAMELIVGAGFTIVADAVPDCVGSTMLTAFTVTVFGAGGTAGAVYSPVASIVPTAAFPPPTPFTDHVRVRFRLPVTFPEN